MSLEVHLIRRDLLLMLASKVALKGRDDLKEIGRVKEHLIQLPLAMLRFTKMTRIMMMISFSLSINKKS